ncbi:hypothetical protein [Vacuolonema iberomarrocanum]|uniref:hypothetical protein n=1 Tax=Vacuolonema iberomarrocanum TaxID=3454632 RepID=UPI001A073F84|nr:hypothetical protein [filamentous cyanobacterium LEGE 07170]
MMLYLYCPETRRRYPVVAQVLVTIDCVDADPTELEADLESGVVLNLDLSKTQFWNCPVERVDGDRGRDFYELVLDSDHSFPTGVIAGDIDV